MSPRWNPIAPSRPELDTYRLPREVKPNDSVIAVQDAAGNAVASISIVSVDGASRHLARARLVHSAPAAVRLVLELIDYDGAAWVGPEGAAAGARKWKRLIASAHDVRRLVESSSGEGSR